MTKLEQLTNRLKELADEYRKQSKGKPCFKISPAQGQTLTEHEKDMIKILEAITSTDEFKDSFEKEFDKDFDKLMETLL